MKQKETTLTVTDGSLFKAGDSIWIVPPRLPWYKRLWNWVTKKKIPVKTYDITSIDSETTFTVK